MKKELEKKLGKKIGDTDEEMDEENPFYSMPKKVKATKAPRKSLGMKRSSKRAKPSMKAVAAAAPLNLSAFKLADVPMLAADDGEEGDEVVDVANFSVYYQQNDVTHRKLYR